MKNRRSIRLKHYDYSQAGAYFVTFCTQNRACLFGHMVDGVMALNPAGEMILRVWEEAPSYYPGIETDAFVIMPNHIHAIFTIVGAAPRGRPGIGQSGEGQPQGVAPTLPSGLSLPDVVHRFKSWTTKQYSDGVRQNKWPSFPGKLWQRNYYERIIRNDDELYRIREYIENNPAQWDLDRENPAVLDTQSVASREMGGSV